MVDILFDFNIREAYPEGARDFTLGESIWFALTSLTPQGGGECPKVRKVPYGLDHGMNTNVNHTFESLYVSPCF